MRKNLIKGVTLGLMLTMQSIVAMEPLEKAGFEKSGAAPHVSEQQLEKSLSLINAIHENLKGCSEVQKLYAPLGIAETLALFGILVEDTEHNIKKELVKFTEDDCAGVLKMQVLNHILTSLSAQSFTRKEYEQEKKFFLSNNLYFILAAENYKPEKVGAVLPACESVGAHIDWTDLSNPENAAAYINGLVDRDTKGAITELVKADPNLFNTDTESALLHTLHIDASWKYLASNSTMHFSLNPESESATGILCKSFTFKKDMFRYLKSNGVTFIELPLIDDMGSLIIRHDGKNTPTPISPAKLAEFQKNAKKIYIGELHVPYVSMSAKLNLKELIPAAGHLTETLNELFKTKTQDGRVFVSCYDQLAKFDMTNAGVKASAATVLIRELESLCLQQPLKINSPFSFALLGKSIPLFLGYVNALEDLKIEDPTPTKNLRSSDCYEANDCDEDSDADEYI